MSTDVLATQDLLGAAWLYRHTADELHELAGGVDALLSQLPVDRYVAIDAARSLAAVGARCRENEAKLRLLVRVSESSDSLLGSRIVRAFQHFAYDVGRVTLEPFTAHPLLVDGVVAFAETVPAIQFAELAVGRLAGEARVHDEGIDPAALANTPPRTTSDIIAGLVLRDRAKHGAIDVRFVQHPDGSRAVIVDITGMASKQFVGHDVTGCDTAVRARDGLRTAYEDGVVQAMRRAGVTKSDAVMMVGHSLGGLVAVNATKTLVRSGYRVTHVLTAGAPIGRTAGLLPPSVRVLALENRKDLVAHLDGSRNPRKPNIATVTFDRSDDGMHDSRRVYLPGVAELEAGGDPEVRDFAASARDFLDGTSVQTHRFTITKSLG